MPPNTTTDSATRLNVDSSAAGHGLLLNREERLVEATRLLIGHRVLTLRGHACERVHARPGTLANKRRSTRVRVLVAQARYTDVAERVQAVLAR